ncbi:TerD family protein [Streptomyces griseus]|uniref:TerD family protein n=1 Tax=Streptomyces griseus TaxID=1911 RepID=UPI0009A123C4
MFPRNQLGLDGSVGDTSGYGRGDDETFAVALRAVPGHVDRIVFFANSFTGRTFEAVRGVSFRFHDEATGQQLGHERNRPRPVGVVLAVHYSCATAQCKVAETRPTPASPSAQEKRTTTWASSAGSSLGSWPEPSPSSCFPDGTRAA